MADREPSTIEVMQRKLDLIARALRQPAFVKTADFDAAWAACETTPVAVPDEES